MEAALDLFLAQGYCRTSLAQIAERASVTRGAAYWHFPNGKPELLNALVSERSALIGEKLLAAESGRQSALENFNAFILGWCETLEKDHDYRRVMQLVVFMVESIPELEDGMQQKQQSIELSIAHLTGLLDQAKQADEIRSDLNTESAALMAYSQLWGLAEIWLLNPNQFSLSEKMQQFIEIYQRGMITSK